MVPTSRTVSSLAVDTGAGEVAGSDGAAEADGDGEEEVPGRVAVVEVVAGGEVAVGAAPVQAKVIINTREIKNRPINLYPDITPPIY
jgi:hypothetical protein